MKAHVPDLILQTLELHGNKAAKEVARVVIENKKGIDELNHAASSQRKKLKNAAIKTLRVISEKAPELTYPFIYYYDYLLGSKDRILKWNATFIISNHAAIDKNNRITGEIVDKLMAQLHDKEIITAGNTASSIWQIARYKPQFRARIVEGLIKAYRFQKEDECKAIIAGKSIQALEELWPLLDKKEEVMDFVSRHLKSQRSGTRKKAEKFIKRHQDELMKS